jgi:hypothetical protein
LPAIVQCATFKTPRLNKPPPTPVNADAVFPEMVQFQPPRGRAEEDPMTTVTFDTLRFVETLKAAGVSEAQAKAIAQAFRDAQGEVDLATKADLRELEHGLRAALAELKADMIKWVAGLLLAQAALVATLVKLL